MTSPPAETQMIQNKVECRPSSWVDLYGDSLFRYAYVRTGDAAAAEDLVQETFIAALKGCQDHRFLGNASEKTWLTGILKHKLLDHYRRKYRELILPHDVLETHSQPVDFDEAGKWKDAPTRWDSSPPDQLEQQEMSRLLLACIDGLQPRQADAVRMRELEELETEEICKVLAITPTNYWVLMHRARLALRKCMERHWKTLNPGDGR